MVVAVATAGPQLIGRERELEIVGGLLDRAWGEEAQTLVVSGDAGVGKTALVAGACEVRQGAGEILVGACLPLTSMSIPFLPIRSALRGNPRLIAPPLSQADGAGRDFAVRFDAWLDEQSDRRPLALVVDDVQWADRSTLDTLMYAVAGPASRRLAIVVTLRSGEVGLGHPLQRWLADVRRLPRTTELELGPLDRAGTAAQVQRLLGTLPHQSLIDDVHAHSRGNPYFTRLLVTGLAPDARAVPASFPADLSSAVLQSWYRLSEPTRQLATRLAVGGRAMRADDLAAVVGDADVARTRSLLLEAVAEGTLDLLDDGGFWFHHPLNAEALEAALGADERREWHRRFADAIEADGGAAASVSSAVAVADHRYRAGEPEAAFDWALRAADAVRGAAGTGEELRLLRRAVDLRAQMPDAEPSMEDVLRRLRRAAEDAGATAEELEAVEMLLERIDEEVDPLRAAALRVRRMHLRFMRGLAFPELPEMEHAVRLASADIASPEYALALAELAQTERWHGSAAADEHATGALAHARAVGDPRALSFALTVASMNATFAGDIAAAAEFGEQAMPPALEARDWFGYVHAALWAANATQSWATEAYAERIGACRRELESSGGPHAYLAWLSAVEANARLAGGAWREADERLRVALGSDPGPLGDVEARLTAARLAALQGQVHEAEAHLRRVEELVVDGSAFLPLEYDAVRAEVRLAAGDTAGAYDAAVAGAVDRGTTPTMAEWLMPFAARALADQAQSARDAGEPAGDVLRRLDALVERFPHVIEDMSTSTEIIRRQVAALDGLYAAECARARAAPEAAESWSLAVAQCSAARLPWEEAYARWRAAEEWLGRGADRSAGAEMLRTGLALARRLRAKPVEEELVDLARRARVPIGEPDPTSPPPGSEVPGLTAREREVLALIAVGRTYSEIARSLVISEKTVSTHVSHLLAKTGSANRVELARLVRRLEHGDEGEDGRTDADGAP
ncbi:helix-turn-helix transcriptional regulator [Agromyces kandeliae]|uniref:helix-turn-helix transcriptional regulator n=1 Tax=Agromyces kandeliae TaxID=2666141 RepID=UPI0018A21232|nr:AAA family ATPase [Agromyces kandeliae]